ncbi:MAG TPA: ectonucleotide pyrophosphatase/phosphodiesterase [Gemmatimonadaceae bacterium]|nr:ectonucleotide pyrophosphatase/phosphodiesterase [Gemmatimonadaceae bacterium]
MMLSDRARRRRTSHVSILCAAVVAISAACTGAGRPAAVADLHAGQPPVGRSTPEPVSGGAATNHVVIVSIDGLRPDAIARFGAATLTRLTREGSYTFAATTIMPSKTLPSHTSMLTGEGPDEHGITWNSNQTDEHATVAIPTVFSVARARGLTTAAFFSKGKFNHLEVPGSLDYTQAPHGDGKWSSSRTIRDVERYLATERPNLLFVHLGDPDYMGHFWGWMSWFYGQAVRRVDGAVERLLMAADRAYGAGNYAVILTADHGGHGRSHGSDRAADVTIPWIAWGEGVQRGTRITADVHTMDTAGTALWLLGVSVPDGWTGVPVREAFSSSAQAVADLAASTAVVSADAGAAPFQR